MGNRVTWSLCALTVAAGALHSVQVEVFIMALAFLLLLLSKNVREAR